MSRKHLILDLALQFFFWNLAYGEDYMVSRLETDLGFPQVWVVTGSSGVRTEVSNRNTTISPYSEVNFTFTNTQPTASSAQFTVHGSPVAVYGAYYASLFPLFPIPALGTDYIVSICHPPGDYTSVLVIATHSQGTDATITFRLTGTLTYAGRQYSDGSTLTLSLDPFDSHSIHSPYDLTGTVVRASDSVAVYTGFVYGWFLYAFNQLLPIMYYGQEYVIAVDGHPDLYSLQIVSDHKDTGIMFNNGSTVYIGESGVYRHKLKRNENIFFTSNRPVMTLLCRASASMFKSVATVVSPVKTYSRTTVLHKRNVIKILADQNATDIRVNVKSKTAPINWENIPHTNYKVGTSKPNNFAVACITSDTSYFATLAYYNGFIFHGGFDFSSRLESTDTRRVDEEAWSDDKVYTSNSQLSALLKGKIVTNNADFHVVIEDVANITEAFAPNSSDLDEILTFVENYKVIANITSETVETLLEIANNVLKIPPDIFTQAQQNNNVANRLIKVVDGITDSLVTTKRENKFISESYALMVVDLTNITRQGRLPIGIQVSEPSANASVQFIYQSNNSFTTRPRSTVFFQEAFLRQIMNNNTGRNVRLSMNYYSNPVLFTLTGNSSHNILKTNVISAKILVDGTPLTQLDNFNVTLAFHQTNDYYGQRTLQSAFALSVITKVGLTLSVAGLSITVISHALFRDKRLTAETRPSSTLLNLSLAQLCSWVVFLAGIDRTENHVGCIVVAALLHYFILASFMWMLAMAVLYYLLIFKFSGAHISWYMIKTGIPAWGIPVLPVVTLLAVDIELYNGGDTYCWMSLPAFYYAFGAPVGLILFANMALYIMLVIRLCKRRASSASKSSQNRSYLQNIKASFLGFIILGLSWIFGFLAISDARLVFQYIFCVTSSLQGFLIFIFFTLQDQRIKDNWRKCCCGIRDTVSRIKRDERPIIAVAKDMSDSPSPSKYTADTKL